MGGNSREKGFQRVIVQDSRGISRSQVQGYREIGHVCGIQEKERVVLSSVVGFSEHIYGTPEETGNHLAQSF